MGYIPGDSKVAMIIPNNLSPLPVLPQAGDAAPDAEPAPDGFVCERTVRQLLVGPLTIADPVLQIVADDDGFAGRPDADLPATPFISRRKPLPAQHEAPAKPFIPDGPHPALSSPRRSAPPRPRTTGAPRRRSPSRQMDRWWVFGMGLGLLLVLGSGALYQLFSRNHAPERPAAEYREVTTPPDPSASLASRDPAAMP